MELWGFARLYILIVFGFFLFRLSKKLDRLQECNDAKGKHVPNFSLEYAQKTSYLLVNTSSVKATGVTFNLGDYPQEMTKDVPDGIQLLPREWRKFHLMTPGAKTLPNKFWVSCDQLDTPIAVYPKTNPG